MKILFLITLTSLLTSCIKSKPSGEKTTTEVPSVTQTKNTEEERGLKIVTDALKNIDNTNALDLYQAASVAFKTNKVEDAALLFYAAQMRKGYDLKRYEPKEGGGNSPAVFIGAMNQMLGYDITSEILKTPKIFAQVVAKLEKYNIEPQ